MVSAHSMLCFAVLNLCARWVQGGQSFARANQKNGRAIIDVPGYAHRLRVCNAYTGSVPVEMVLQQGVKDTRKEINLTKAGALPYKSCRDFPSEQLYRGDSVEFKFAGEHLASFAVSALPRRRALLLLVLHRKPQSPSMAAFTSHIFADVPHAQVAILDMYQGKAKSQILIEDLQDTKGGRKEKLAYDSVVAINGGKYKCVLSGSSKGKEKEAPLLAHGSGSYVAIRVGGENSAFTEDIMVYPGLNDAAARAPLTLLCLLGFLWWIF